MLLAYVHQQLMDQLADQLAWDVNACNQLWDHLITSNDNMLAFSNCNAKFEQCDECMPVKVTQCVRG